MPLDDATIKRLVAVRDRTTQVDHKGPLGVLTRPGYCTWCPGNIAKAMYTVNGIPLCTPHAMYQLSVICVENDYNVQVAGRVENGNPN